MKEAIGNSFLIGIVIVFLFLIMGLMISSLTYSKAYKAKNKIINVIEKYNGYNDAAQKEVYADLAIMGYKINTQTFKCKQIENYTLIHDGGPGKYHYCVYGVNTARGIYYHVVTYMHFDLPIFGDKFAFPVDGDSRTVYQNLKG